MHPPIILVLFTRGFAGASGSPGDKNSASSTVSVDPRSGGAGIVTGFFALCFIGDGDFGLWQDSRVSSSPYSFPYCSNNSSVSGS